MLGWVGQSSQFFSFIFCSFFIPFLGGGGLLEHWATPDLE